MSIELEVRTLESKFKIAAAAAAKSLQSCPTLSDPMDCSLPGSSVHGIFQARVLEWGATLLLHSNKILRAPCLYFLTSLSRIIIATSQDYFQDIKDKIYQALFLVYNWFRILCVILSMLSVQKRDKKEIYFWLCKSTAIRWTPRQLVI